MIWRMKSLKSKLKEIEIFKLEAISNWIKFYFSNISRSGLLRILVFSVTFRIAFRFFFRCFYDERDRDVGWCWWMRFETGLPDKNFKNMKKYHRSTVLVSCGASSFVSFYSYSKRFRFNGMGLWWKCGFPW